MGYAQMVYKMTLRRTIQNEAEFVIYLTKAGGKAGPERAMMNQFENYISVEKLFPTDGANCKWEFLNNKEKG